MLDLQKLLDMQKELDKTIFNNSRITEYPLEKVKLALLVELGELANEVKCFKYWKKHKEINKERILDEFADCLHFALSLENELHQTSYYKEWYIEEIIKRNKKLEKATDDGKGFGFLETYRHILSEDEILKSVIALGILIGFSAKEMEQAYLSKNKVNYERQTNGY